MTGQALPLDDDARQSLVGLVCMSIRAALGLSEVETEQVLRMAGAAPSLHNSQPWCFLLRPEVIELYAVPERRLPAADPEDRELRLACGAALLNLRLGLEQRGIRPFVTLGTGTRGSWKVAEIRAGGRRPVHEQDALYRAITKRRSNRRPFLDVPVPARHIDAVLEAARVERGWVHVIEQRQRGELEALVQWAHHRQQADERFRAEFATWTGRLGGESSGVPVEAAGPAPEGQDRWVRRDYAGGRARVRVPGKDFEVDPMLLVLCSDSGEPTAEVRAGQALQRAWLTATSLGLVASMISQVVEVPHAREQVRRMVGAHLHPQALLRVGFGSVSPPAPRRSPEDLVVDEPITGWGA